VLIAKHVLIAYRHMAQSVEAAGECEQFS